MMRFLIYSSGFNCADFVRDCLNSVRAQRLSHYIHVVVDDASTDGTWEMIQKFKDTRVRAYRSFQNRKWTQTAMEYLKPQAHDIVVILDLDDRLAHPRALKRIEREYKKGCWLTYGNYRRTSRDGYLSRVANWIGIWRARPGWQGCCRQLPPDVVRERSFRQYTFTTSHLRSFKGFLWNAIRPNDLLDWNGQYPAMAGDVAVMLPMLDMCAPGKIVFIPDVLSVYNDTRALNEHTLDRALQEKTEMWFRQKPCYPLLSAAPSDAP
jgi:glycosyltransferase involved in cell wall biosynthesis